MHGSGSPDLSIFEPRQADDLREFGNQRAVYAAGDGIWAMFYAVANRGRIQTMTNACIRLVDRDGVIGPPLYVFSISRATRPEEAWRSGTVYILPGDTFELQPAIPFGELQVQIPQLASRVAVAPLARVPVQPADFPFLHDVRRHDDERLEEYTRALETAAPWPDRSAT